MPTISVPITPTRIQILRLVQSPVGDIAYFRAEGAQAIASASEFLDLLANCPAETPAGEPIQKVLNYRRRPVVLGDFSSVASRALRDFNCASNRTGQVVAAADLEEAARLLRPA